MTANVHQASARPIPRRGDIAPVLRGRTAAGEAASTRDFYLRRNLAILFVGDNPDGTAWLLSASKEVEAAAAEAGQIVVVASQAVETFGLYALVDDGRELRSLYGLAAEDLPALFITDRYGVVFVATHGEDADKTLHPRDIPRWLEFVACRCS